MTFDRAGGTYSEDASGNPPAIFIDVSYKSLIDSLKQRGFTDAQSGECGYLLQRVSYVHLSPYIRLAERCPTRDGPTVKMAHDVMTFDRRYQATLMKYIGIFEMQMRAQYSHHMRINSGDFPLYNPSLFLRSEMYSRTFNVFEREVVTRRRNRDARVTSALSTNGGMLPVELATECMSLGCLMRFYANTKDRRVTGAVSNSFGTSKSNLISWGKTITSVRNICAHFEPYVTRAQIPSTPRRLQDTNADNNQTFYIVLLLLSLLSSNAQFPDKALEYSFRMKLDIASEVNGFALLYSHALQAMGIPGNWRQLIESA